MLQNPSMTVFCLTALLASGCGDDSAVGSDFQPTASVKHALDHAEYLAETIGKRVTGDNSEIEARDYIFEQFEDIGFDDVELQEFEFERGSQTGASANVIATKRGASDQIVIVGGHYDSVAANGGSGYSDNAVSIGALLALAEAIEALDPPYTIQFVAFGAEEVDEDDDGEPNDEDDEGLYGSTVFADELAEDDKADVIAMINLDTIVGGDNMYVYGGLEGEGWLREQSMALATDEGIELRTNPGKNPDYPAGTTGPWSDHVAFEALGIPIAYFEATNWDIGDLDGYVQTEQEGELWHTDKDTYEFIEDAFPGRIERQLSDFLIVLERLLLEIDPNSST